MNDKQQDLVVNLVLHYITEKDFNEQYPLSMLTKPTYLLEQLQEVYKTQDPSQLESTLLLIFFMKISQKDMPRYCRKQL